MTVTPVSVSVRIPVRASVHRHRRAGHDAATLTRGGIVGEVGLELREELFVCSAVQIIRLH